MVFWISWLILAPLVFIFLPTRIIGKKYVKSVKKQAAITSCNHQSNGDPIILKARVNTAYKLMAKESLFKNPALRFLAYVFGVYPVKQGNKSMESMKVSLKLLKNKELLLIFPEGTRNGMAKGVKPKDGAIKLAAKSNAPIVPVGIQGSFKPFTKVKVNIGKPISYNLSKEELNNKENLSKLTENLMNEIVKLRDEKI